jgi:hypothetical protein
MRIAEALKAGTDRRDLGADIAMIPLSLLRPGHPERRPSRPNRPTGRGENQSSVVSHQSVVDRRPPTTD